MQAILHEKQVERWIKTDFIVVEQACFTQAKPGRPACRPQKLDQAVIGSKTYS